VSVTEILTLISATTVALVAIIHAWKAQPVCAQVRETNAQVHDLGKALNGRLAALLERTREAAYHAGLLEGQRLARSGERLPVFELPPREVP
jgi:hypothetical protein